MSTTLLPPFTSLGMEIDGRDVAFGELRGSAALVGDPEALRARMKEDGYLFLPGYLDREEVLAARGEITRRLSELGVLDEEYPAMDAVMKPGARAADPDALTAGNLPLKKLLYSGRMIEFYERLLGGAVRHYDFTWFRTLPGGGQGTYPHCDVVYMGRGTRELFTAWTPIGDAPRRAGALMILENSHLRAEYLQKYLERDVDTYCTNYPDAGEIESGRKQWQDWDGRLSSNPVSLREKLEGRWLSTDFRAGDLLTFGMATVHASLDNQTECFRLSSDSRYQLASEPVDERWIGAHPVGHGAAGKKGKTC